MPPDKDVSVIVGYPGSLLPLVNTLNYAVAKSYWSVNIASIITP